MNTVIFGGGGQMGQAIAYAMGRLGYNVYITDIYPEKIQECIDKNAALGVKVTECNNGFWINMREAVSDPSVVIEQVCPDVVISAVPYEHCLLVASVCLEAGFRYCDLGGNPDVSRKIRTGNHSDKPFFTDLGLAPGLVNIMAEYGCNQVNKPHDVHLAVGGLPAKLDSRFGSLQYGRVFSLAGLKNEYEGNCQIIRYGKVVDVPALSDCRDFRSNWKNTQYWMESFYTKGGLGTTLDSMLERGVQNCSYKTIRYPGHAEKIRFLLKECNIDDETFDTLMTNACPEIKDDLVLISVEINGEYLGEDMWVKQALVEHDENWTAMQKATAFPTAAAAAIMGYGVLDYIPSPQYKDLPLQEFAENLRLIGGLPELF